MGCFGVRRKSGCPSYQGNLWDFRVLLQLSCKNRRPVLSYTVVNAPHFVICLGKLIRWPVLFHRKALSNRKSTRMIKFKLPGRSHYHLLATVACCISLIGFAGCGMGEFGGSSRKTAGDELNGKLVVTGSSTVAPLLAEIASRFEDDHSSVRVDVQTGGSSRGIRDAHSGVADIGMSSRHLKASELSEVQTRVIAWDGVAFVVHKDNPVDQLSLSQLKDIYTGKINQWASVGGKQGQIVVSNRANGRSEQDLVCGYLDLKPGQIQADVVDGETQQSIKTVITNRKAITYTSVGAAQDAVRRGEPIKLLPLDGVVASSESVSAGEFPLARPLVLIFKNSNGGSKQRLIDAFLEFSCDEDVSDASVNLGFVPNHEGQSR